MYSALCGTFTSSVPGDPDRLKVRFVAVSLLIVKDEIVPFNAIYPPSVARAMNFCRRSQNDGMSTSLSYVSGTHEGKMTSLRKDALERGY